MLGRTLTTVVRAGVSNFVHPTHEINGAGEVPEDESGINLLPQAVGSNTTLETNERHLPVASPPLKLFREYGIPIWRVRLAITGLQPSAPLPRVDVVTCKACSISGINGPRRTLFAGAGPMLTYRHRDIAADDRIVEELNVLFRQISFVAKTHNKRFDAVSLPAELIVSLRVTHHSPAL